ncbi:unnamed protein product [Blepharisma stoltei]|uniref:Uncharacterized protein n=1 Tax=Blepharisma stoltei TaxID=1481888 RepID=A0AAU9JMT7_9CILI|nr:unnamed protein product [Blepharisma stoltei]
MLPDLEYNNKMDWLKNRKKSMGVILGLLFATSFFWVVIVYSEEAGFDDSTNSNDHLLFKDSKEDIDNRWKISHHMINDTNSTSDNQTNQLFVIESQVLASDIYIFDKNIKCYPQNLGYTKSQSDSRFKYQNRALKCSSGDELFSMENNTLYINCLSFGPAQYSLGNSPENEIIGNVKYLPEWKSYSSPVDIGDREFGFIKCGRDKKQAWLHNKFSQKIFNKTQEKRKNIMSSLNLPETPKPLTVLLIVVDSLSRQHFYRTMKNTVEFMNTINSDFSENYIIYDFFNGNSHGENTQPNLAPLLYGRSLADLQIKTKGLSLKKSDDAPKYQKIQESIIWKHFENHGFVTMFEWETRWDYFPDLAGRKVLCDHVATSFWRGAVDVAGFTDFSEKQRCIGNHHSHEYLFNYTKEFIENYAGLNKFGYMHLISAHEVTGSVVQAMDNDLSRFFEEIMNFHIDKNEDLAIFLVSDHGNHMGPWDRYEEGTVENLSPFTFFITNKQFLSKVNKNSHEIILHNTQRLVGKYDIYLTLQQLALLPYGNPSDQYKNWKNEIKINSVVSLLYEKIPDNRTCEDIGVPLYWCNCLAYKKIEIADEKGLAHHIANEAVSTINKKNSKDKAQEFCLEVKFDYVIKIEEETKQSQNYSGNMYKVTFAIKERSGVIFEAFAFVGNTIKFIKIEVENQYYPISKWKNFEVQVQKIVRVDTLDDYCGELAEQMSAKASFCVCKYPDSYELQSSIPQKRKLTIEKLKKNLSISIGGIFENCIETCSKLNKKCEKWGLPLLNRLEILNEPWRSSRSSIQVHKDNQNIDFKTLRVSGNINGEVTGLMKESDSYKFMQSDWSNLTCEARSENIMPICPCTLYSFI